MQNSVQAVLHVVEANLGRSLAKLEIDYVISYVRQCHEQQKPINNRDIINTLNQQLRRVPYDPSANKRIIINTADAPIQTSAPIDTKSRNRNSDNFASIIQQISTATGSTVTHQNISDIDIISTHILVDTKYRNIANFNNYGFAFQTAPVQKPDFSGNIYVPNEPKYVVQIQIGSFNFPILDSNNFINYYERIYLRFTEFQEQAVSLAYNRQYHFAFRIERESKSWRLIPDDPTFNFFPPVNTVNTLTFAFLTPDNDIGVILDRDFNATVTYGSPTTITTSMPQTLSTNDLIYITTFNTGNVNFDLLVLNNTLGYKISKLSSTQFTISLDTSAFAGTQSNVTVVFGNARLLIPLMIKSISKNI